MTPRIEKTIFISYRRTNLPWALAIFQNLKNEGYDVFFDYLSIPSGDFENIIVENIKARAHFVVILTPSALERCNEPGDWLRREIETAIDGKRNIIPLMLESFDFGSPSTVNALTGKLEGLKKYNGLRLHSEYFFEGMVRLREQYLNVSLDAVVHPISDIAKPATKESQVAASESAPVEKEQLTAQEWFERGYVFDNIDEAIRCYTEAIKLDPTFSSAYLNRGVSLAIKEDLDNAIEDFNQAIRINPNFAAYSNRGNALRLKGKNDLAIQDLNEAIHLQYDAAGVFVNRGLANEAKGNLDDALKDFNESIRLDSNNSHTFFTLGALLTKMKRYEEAESAYRNAIELKPTYKSTYANFGKLLSDMRRYEDAEAIYQKAVELYPSDVESIYDLGRHLADEYVRKYDEAEKIFSKVLQLDSNHSNTLYCLACIKSLQQDVDIAFHYLQLAISNGFDRNWAWKDPDLEWIRNDPRFTEIVGVKPD